MENIKQYEDNNLSPIISWLNFKYLRNNSLDFSKYHFGGCTTKRYIWNK